MKPIKFGENYFKNQNYTDYLERRDRYFKFSQEIHELLGCKLQVINKSSKILDYGCATGFLMEGFRDLGYKNVYGYDISKWAVGQARKKGLDILDRVKRINFDIITCFDVLEHMTDKEIYKTFTKFKSDTMIVRIPCSIDEKRFVLKISNRDKTHINCKTKENWIKLLSKLGYKTILPLGLFTIYDTPGVMCSLCLKPKLKKTQYDKS